MSHNLLDLLADEILLEILGYLFQGFDTKSFQKPATPLNPRLLAVAMTSKRLHRITLPLLYQKIAISTAMHVDKLLELLMTSFYYAGLIRSVWLGWVSHTFEDDPSEEDSTGISIMNMVEDGRHDDSMAATRLAEVVRELALPPGLVSRIQEGHSWAKSLLLLRILPQLEEIQINGESKNDEFDRILSYMLRLGIISPTLNFFGRSNGRGIIEVDMLVPAFLYGGIKHIRGFQAISPLDNLRIDSLLPRGTTFSSWYGKSNVERIELHSCTVDGGAIIELLKFPRALKTFIYSEDGNHNGEMKEDFECALTESCETLENLSFRWKEVGEVLPNDHTWILDDFTSLRHVFISYRLIFGTQPRTAVITSNKFPPSLEVLGMFPSQPDAWQIRQYGREDDWENHDYINCFKDLLLQKDSKHLPKLRLIAHLDDLPLLQPLVEIAESRGVQVALRQVDLASVPI
ncbi:hypothetical protein CPB86DRAFT_797093 [Serendipita vermifera]|nr:hypothetical protein CPB86DRAFT_797093 [Serendipita vermifera]